MRGGGEGVGRSGGGETLSPSHSLVPLNRVSFFDGIEDLLERSLTVNSSPGPR